VISAAREFEPISKLISNEFNARIAATIKTSKDGSQRLVRFIQQNKAVRNAGDANHVNGPVFAISN
jgi:hypothetical protein